MKTPNQTQPILRNSLQEQLDNGFLNLHQILYCPTTAELVSLSQLFDTVLHPPKTLTTTQVGGLFNDWVVLLLTFVKCFSVSSKVRAINQFDITIVNSINCENSSLFHIMGNSVLAECKNERKTPKNDYFGKLSSILLQCDISLGIMLSIKKAPSTYNRMAHELYMYSMRTQKKTFLIAMSIDEFKAILAGVNLLDVINEKITLIQVGATTSWISALFSKYVPNRTP